MIALVRSELLKVRSTQVWLWLLLLAVALTSLATIANTVQAIDNHGLADPIDYYELYTSSRQAGFCLLVLGILGLTTEFRHKTITPTLLATPDRWTLLGGKAMSYAVLSVVYSAVCITVNLVLAGTWLSAKGIPVEYGHGVPLGLLKVLVSMVLLGVLGLGLGALVRNQAAAMVLGIVYLIVLNPLLAAIPWIRRAWPYEPGGALTAFTAAHRPEGVADDVHLLASVPALFVLLAWCLGVLAAGGVVGLRRDIS